jgi:hypothetical protein
MSLDALQDASRLAKRASAVGTVIYANVIVARAGRTKLRFFDNRGVLTWFCSKNNKAAVKAALC